MDKKILNLVIIFALLVLLFIFLGKSRSKNSNKISQPEQKLEINNEVSTTTTAYDFNLSDIKGKKVKLSDFKGNVVILNFWATWCPPCRMEIPSFIELYKKYKNDGLTIIGVAIDNEVKVKNFVKDNNINYPVLIADETTIMKYGGIRGIPTTFIIDKNGNIKNQYVGYRPKETFEESFKALK